MNTSESIRILTMDSSENSAEAMVNLLTEQKLSVTNTRVHDKTRLVQSIKNQDWDILLLNETVTEINAEDCRDYLRQFQRDSALVVLTQKPFTLDALTPAWQKGIDALVCVELPEYSVAELEKQYRHLQTSRQQLALADQNDEFAERCDLLLSSSGEALAYVHDGMHIYGNDAYLKLFGIQDQDELICIPFVDMVASADAGNLKSTLKSLQKQQQEDGSETETELELTALRVGGADFRAHMKLKPTSYEGEDCMLVLVTEAEAESKPNAEVAEAKEVPVLKPEPEPKPKPETKLTLEPREEPETSEEEKEKPKETVQKKEEPTKANPHEAVYQRAVLQKSEPKKAAPIKEEQKKEKPKKVSARSGKAGKVSTPAAGEKSVKPVPADKPLKVSKEFITSALENNMAASVYHSVIATDLEPEFFDIELRLYDSASNVYAPADFLPAINGSSLGLKLDQWAISHALQVMMNVYNQGQALQFAFTLTSNALSDRSFYTWLERELNTRGLDANALILNIHEKDIQNDQVKVETAIDRMHQIGIKICVTEFSNAPVTKTLLSRDKVDLVRFKSLHTGKAITDEKFAEELSGLVEELHRHNVKAIGQAVNDATALSVLWNSGVDLVQGKYFQQAPQELREDSFNDHYEILKTAG